MYVRDGDLVSFEFHELEGLDGCSFDGGLLVIIKEYVAGREGHCGLRHHGSREAS